jgi:F-type H+-transporting ATPase subunit epsilon
MTDAQLPARLKIEIVTPEGLLLRDEVDDVVAPGAAGSFGVRPGHTPFLCTLGAGEISYGKGGDRHRLTCFWGFCEVLPDRVSILAEIGERAETIDLERAEEARTRAAARLKSIRDEAGFDEAHEAYVRAVTRLAVARRNRDQG